MRGIPSPGVTSWAIFIPSLRDYALSVLSDDSGMMAGVDNEALLPHGSCGRILDSGGVCYTRGTREVKTARPARQKRVEQSENKKR